MMLEFEFRESLQTTRRRVALDVFTITGVLEGSLPNECILMLDQAQRIEIFGDFDAIVKRIETGRYGDDDYHTNST